MAAGRLDVDKALSEISSQQLQEWEHFWGMEPFGEDRADLRMGMICATIVNSNPWRKKSARSVSATDFMPFYKQQKGPARRQSWQEQKLIAIKLTAAWGGKIVDKHG